MADPHDLSAELHRHGTALRGIARDLLRDPHAAEDVTQDTLRAALAQRGLQPGPLGGWLQRTLVNFVHQWRRGERRRTARLQHLTGPEPAAAPPDALDRRETLQAVTNAVLALDEPYQTAIFLRYFEDLPPRCIARRTGANLATVKSRLQRGLAMLRARLDRQCGGDRQQWRLALLGTFGLPLPMAAAGLTLGTGAWLMGTTTKTLAAAALCGLGGLFLYAWQRDPAPFATPVAADHAPAPAAEATGDRDPSAGSPDRIAADTAAPTVPWLQHAYLLELEVLAVDPTGLPVEGHTLRLAPPNCTLNDAPKATGADGRVVLSWASRQPSGAVVLADERGTLRRIALQHGNRTTVTLGAKPRGGDATLRLYATGTRKVSSRLSEGVPVLTNIPVVGNLFSGQGGGSPDMRSGLHPHAVFGNQAAPAETGSEVATSSSTERVLTIVEGLSFRTTVRGLAVSNRNADEQGQPQRRIAGTVFGTDGKPATKIPIVLLGKTPQPLQRAQTDDNGQFVFDDVAAGEFTVRAGGTDAGLATLPVVTTMGTTPATLHLLRGSCLRGRAVDSEGAPLAGAQVAFRAADGSWWDSTETLQDGSFVLANLPGSAGTVLLWEANSDRPLRVATAANVLADTPDLLLQFDDRAASSLQLDLALPEGRGRLPVEVRVWQLDTGIGVRVPAPGEGKPWRLDRLPAGWYGVELFAAGAGWLDLGRHWLDGKTECDLGRAALPAPATAAVHLPELPPADAPPPPPGEENKQVELYELRRDVDVRHEVGAIDRGSTLHLPAGDYALGIRDATGAVHFHRFSARSGETVEIAPKRQ